jgi:pimeloyl-ACP methyl ester carboxylesterase
MNAPLHESHLSACGIRTRVLQAGANLRATEAVVLVHGNPGSGEDWAELMGHLAPYGRAIALDMPGFGKADKPSDYPYSVEGGASFLGEALKQLGVSRAHLVLHDFGGPWGLMWAAMSPLSVGSLTLINTGVLLGYRWHTMARIWRTPILGELQQWLTHRAGFKWVLRKGSPRALPEAFLDRMYDDLDTGTRRAILKLYRATSEPSQGAELLAKLLRPHRWPTLVVWGDADPYLPAPLAERQRDVFAQAEVVLLPGSGHFPFADNPEAVAQTVTPFLARQLGHADQP